VGRRKKRRWRRAIGASIAVSVSLAFLTVFIFLADFDGDGLKNLDEISTNTGVLNPDTDGDGLSDGLEVDTYVTNPLMMDTDGDGLGDEIEVLGSWHVFELESSAWGDRVYTWTLKHKTPDGTVYRSWQGNSWTWPYHHENILMTDNGLVFLTSDPLSVDTDGDGLDDKMEYEIGTNPKSKDTDNDGLEDIAELTTYKTIPLLYDTDGDLLGDGEEINEYSTDPLNWDSDNDHLSDGIEVKGYDVDGNGIIDVNFPAFGADPLVKDIFVEIDWMPAGQTLGSYARGKLVEAFAEHGIVLHIDQGELGGGEETEERPNILYDNRDGPMNDFYDFEQKYFTPSRRGVFYWCLITSGATYLGQKEVGGFNVGDIFTVAGTWSSDAFLGSAFMHELGHALGLDNSDFDGIDSRKYSFDEYRSVMNYNAPYDFYDYSDGPPFNEWEHINFEHLWGRNIE
jgi:hypothetical protein